MSRVDDDREKLLEACGAFRLRANLHGSSSDMALVRWAHTGGKGKPYADMVREKWHDYAMARQYAELRVVEYVIEYSGDESSDGDSARSVDENVGDRPRDSGAESPSVTPEPAPETDPFCGHKVVTNDGAVVACDKCGEVLGEVVDEVVEWKDGHAYDLVSSRPDEPQRKPRTKSKPPADEVLF